MPLPTCPGLVAEVHDESALRAAVEAGAVPVRVRSGEALVGPLRAGARPGCGLCAWTREQRITGGPLAQPDARLTPATARALEALADLVRADAAPVAYSLDLTTLAAGRHPVLPDPRCEVCGSPLPDDEPLTAPPAGPQPAVPTSWRTQAVDADAVLARYVDSHVGLVPRVERGMGFPFPAMSAVLASGPGGTTGSGFGRELSYAQARTVGVLEALERLGGFVPLGRRTVVHASRRELGDDALDPRGTGLATAAQVADPRYPFKPYDDDLRYPWVWGRSVTRARPVLVPEQLAYYRVREPNRFVYDISNGCALGSTLAEATLHGILELVERDAFLLTWYRRRPAPELDLRKAGALPLVTRLRQLTGLVVRAFDVTTDTGIPAVWIVGQLTDPRTELCPGLICAAASGFDRGQAVRSAVLELAGMATRSTLPYGADLSRVEAMLADPALVTAMDDHLLVNAHPAARARLGFLLDTPVDEREPMPQASWRPEGTDVAEALDQLVRHLSALGLETVTVDQTAPEHEAGGLHCVKVLVPGLLPMTFGHLVRRTEGLPRLGTGPLNPDPHPFP